MRGDLVRRWLGVVAVVVAGVVLTGAVVERNESDPRPGRSEAPDSPGAAADECPEAGGEPVARLPRSEPARLAPEADAALAALAAASGPLPCGTVAGLQDQGQGHGGHEGHGDGHVHPVDDAADPGLLQAQWDAAVAAAAGLTTREQAAAAGYVKASPQVPGVGTHWIRWPLVDAPFDPTRPSMLLFDETPGRAPRLAGFSYWVRSPTAPAGFAGADDAWHGHRGLCFADGWLHREAVAAADACPGEWLNGGDLWMLHAWVVPGLDNPAGRFAPRHDALCPGDFARTADVLTCDPRD